MEGNVMMEFLCTDLIGRRYIEPHYFCNDETMTCEIITCRLICTVGTGCDKTLSQHSVFEALFLKAVSDAIKMH